MLISISKLHSFFKKNFDYYNFIIVYALYLSMLFTMFSSWFIGILFEIKFNSLDLVGLYFSWMMGFSIIFLILPSLLGEIDFFLNNLYLKQNHFEKLIKLIKRISSSKFYVCLLSFVFTFIRFRWEFEGEVFQTSSIFIIFFVWLFWFLRGMLSIFFIINFMLFNTTLIELKKKPEVEKRFFKSTRLVHSVPPSIEPTLEKTGTLLAAGATGLLAIITADAIPRSDKLADAVNNRHDGVQTAVQRGLKSDNDATPRIPEYGLEKKEEKSLISQAMEQEKYNPSLEEQTTTILKEKLCVIREEALGVQEVTEKMPAIRRIMHSYKGGEDSPLTQMSGLKIDAQHTANAIEDLHARRRSVESIAGEFGLEINDGIVQSTKPAEEAHSATEEPTFPESVSQGYPDASMPLETTNILLEKIVNFISDFF